MLHRIIRSWYTGRWSVGCYIWYSEERSGRAAAPPSPILAVPNVTAHPSTASVPITVLLYDGPLLCGLNVAIKGLIVVTLVRSVFNVTLSLLLYITTARHLSFGRLSVIFRQHNMTANLNNRRKHVRKPSHYSSYRWTHEFETKKTSYYQRQKYRPRSPEGLLCDAERDLLAIAKFLISNWLHNEIELKFNNYKYANILT